MNHAELYLTATRLTFVEHLRNRLAMALIAVFIPTWISLAYFVFENRPVPFRLQATGEVLHPPGNEFTQIAGAVNALTLIVGFMMFAATFTSGTFDRRLAMAGYPRVHLLLAKLTALTLVSAAVAVYATAVTCVFWSPRRLLLFTAALLCASLTYGGFGILFGSLLRREVEGMFAIVMTSCLDVGLQNPVHSSGANGDLVQYLPCYGALQAGTAVGFSAASVPTCFARQLAWFLCAITAGLMVFRRSTRRLPPPSRTGFLRRRPRGVPRPTPPVPAAPPDPAAAPGAD
ncbi:hypothetical protein GCM10010129_70990 [Streptomyces fumigatiscleroticus]|nr:hypothetical protein GCM10010129_70990 [Streptomyces fumigatiscleroticus]